MLAVQRQGVINQGECIESDPEARIPFEATCSCLPRFEMEGLQRPVVVSQIVKHMGTRRFDSSGHLVSHDDRLAFHIIEF